MSKIKVAVANTIGKVVFINTEATRGATLGTDVYLPNGDVGTPKTIRNYLGLGNGAYQHRDLGGLTVGDDHPQYTMWADQERITGQWNFVTAVWGADGTTALPEFAFTEDPTTGASRISAADAAAVFTFTRQATFKYKIVDASGPSSNPEYTTLAYDDSAWLTSPGEYNSVAGPGVGLVLSPAIARAVWARKHFTVTEPYVGGDIIVTLGHDDGGWLWFNDVEITVPNYNIATFSTCVIPAHLVRVGDNLLVARSIDGVPGGSSVGCSLSIEATTAIAGSTYTISTDGELRTYTNEFNTTSLVPIVIAHEDGLTIYQDSTTLFQADSDSILSTVVNLGPAGTASAPTWSFSGDPNTGIYNPADNTLAIALGSADRWVIDTVKVLSSVLYFGPSGSATVPAISFFNDPDTGIWNPADNVIGFAVTGANRASMTGAGLVMEVPVKSIDGTVTAPGYTFNTDTNTGFYSIGADILGITTGGVLRLGFGAAGEILDAAGSAGTSGQVPTSAGSGAAWAWGTPSGGGGGGGSLVYVNTTVPAGNTVANTSTETAFASTYDIPTGQLAVGTVVHARLYGTYGTDAVAPTLRLKLKLDSTTVLDTTAVTMTGSLVNRGWFADVQLVVTATGVSGTADRQALVEFSTGTASGALVNTPNTSTVTVDTTQAQTVSVTAQWSAADTDNTITLRQMAIWLENAVTPTAAAPASATYLTSTSQTTTLPNSRQLIAGTNVTFDDTVSGQRTISASGGGGGSGNVDPDTHPSSPNAADDEFESGSSINLAKWTARNVSGGSATVSQGSLCLTSGNTGSDNLYCYEQAIVSPSSPWKIRAKIGTWGAATGGDIRAGLYVVNNANGKMDLLATYYAGGAAQSFVNHNTNASTYANTLLLTATTNTGGRESFSGNVPLYYEIEYNGTNIYFRQSQSGVDGTYVEIANESPAAFLGAVPTHFGIACGAATANSGGGVFDWFRRIS
jgi:hypothetical protein